MRVALPFGRTPEPKRPAYRKALHDAGIQGIEIADSLRGLDGLLLAGGTDVDPALYGQKPHEKTALPDVDRDTLEARLVREALERDLPVLAICRGQQMLNVVLGGTLRQHIEGHKSEARDAHPVSIAAGTRLERILGRDELTVNSRHHQAVDRLGEGLAISATADSIVEGLEMPGKRFVVAVQWHPEDRIDGDDARLFAAFADALRK